MRAPECPFCGKRVEPPKNLGFQFADFDCGFCECGAVYVSDVTGFNRGAALAQALFLASGASPEVAWELVPGEDFQEAILERYDQTTHQIVPEGYLEGRRISGILYFVRVSEELKELQDRLKELLKDETCDRPLRKDVPKLRRAQAERLVSEGRLEELVKACVGRPSNTRALQKLLYHPDPHLRLKTAYFLGVISKYLVASNPEEVSDLVKRLLYAGADSAASAWGALEAVGEIIRNLPERFGSYTKNLMAFLKYEEFRPSALYALYRIAERHPELLKSFRVFSLVDFLKDGSPLVRGLSLLILDSLGLRESLKEIRELFDDEEEFEVYLPELGEGRRFRLSRLAKEGRG